MFYTGNLACTVVDGKNLYPWLLSKWFEGGMSVGKRKVSTPATRHPCKIQVPKVSEGSRRDVSLEA